MKFNLEFWENWLDLEDITISILENDGDFVAKLDGYSSCGASKAQAVALSISGTKIKIYGHKLFVPWFN